MEFKVTSTSASCCCVALVVSDSVQPHRWQPTRLSVPGILQARTLEWVDISFSNAWKWKVKVNSLSCVRLLATPWTAAYQAPLSMGFSRQKYWSGVPLLSPFCFIDYAKAYDCVAHSKLWKILKELGIPDHLTYLLRNLHADQKTIVRTGCETTDWFKTGKGVCQGCIMSPCLFNLYAKYIM